MPESFFRQRFFSALARAGAAETGRAVAAYALAVESK
jgi:hypothetical protein